MSSQKFRNYAFIVYPESMCDDFFDKLANLMLPCFVSPLHDSDVKDDGEIKKAHYHIIIRYSNPVSISHAVKDLLTLDVNQPPEVVKSLRAYARYLCHLDQSDKAQYNIDDVRQINCSDYYDVCKLDSSLDVMAQMDAIEDLIDDNDIISYRFLCRLIRKHYPELRNALRSHPSHFSSYLRSVEYERTVLSRRGEAVADKFEAS